ncbi:MAG: magnesium transporter CorA family protein [Thermoguttaceae bacterium]
MLRNFRLEDGRLVPVTDGDGIIQVFVNPDEQERRHLVNQLEIDAHTLTSALDPDELSRVEFEPAHVAIIYKRPKHYSSEDHFLFRTASTGLFVFKDRLIAVLAEDAAVFDHGRDLTSITNIQDLVLKLIHRSIVQFNGHMKAIAMIVDELEKKLASSMSNKHLLHLFKLERSLVYYLSALSANGTLLERLRLSSAKIGFTPEQLELLEDIIVDNGQCYKQAEISSSIMAGMMDARASVVNNNLNLLMKRLTVLSLVFLPLNLIASIGGMSEFSVMTGVDATSPWFYWWLAYGGFGLAMFFIGWAAFYMLERSEHPVH